MPQEETQQQPNDQQTPPEGEKPETWEGWLEAQPDTVKTLYEAHTSGLRSALEEERSNRKAFEKQLREWRDKAEKGSDAEARLNETLTALETTQRRADFLEAASKPENNVADLKAAWLIVNAEPDTYLNKRGAVDFALLKQNHPALFRKAPGANAGSGVGQTGGKADINAMIRQAAGRS